MALLVSCSKDDGGGGSSETELQLLIDHGDWNFQSAEVLEIGVNSEPPRSKQEIQDILMDEKPGTIFKFHDDGAGSRVLPSGESVPFPYTVEYSNGKIKTISIGGTDFDNVAVTANSLQFTRYLEWQVYEGGGSENWVAVDARLTFKH